MRRVLSYVSISIFFFALPLSLTIAGDIPFGSQQVISTAVDFPTSIYAADIDGDGNLDLLSASSYDDKIAWYENTDGAGTFGSQQVINIADPDAPLTGLEGNADGARTVFASDIDGDGDFDVLSASTEDNKIAWYENTDGAGTFGLQQIISSSTFGAWSVFAADLDGDGDMDVLSANDDSVAVIEWYENTDGAGTFSSSQIISTDVIRAHSVSAADVDRDGDIDVLSASWWDDKIAWYENTDGGGTFGPQQIISTNAEGAHAVLAADLDGDGDLDALSASAVDDKIAWYENTDGAGTFGLKPSISTAADRVYSIYTADMDNDGDIDVLSASGGDDKIAWYENTDSAGTFGTQQVISFAADGAYSVITADLDRDGDLDVISSSVMDDEIAWYENESIHRNATFPTQSVISIANNGPRTVFAADIDGAGDADIISATFIGFGISWYENTDGVGSFGPKQVISATAENIWSVYAADIDSDGDLDVLAVSTTNSEITWYENTDGTGTFGAKQIISTAADQPTSVYAADMDSDGDIDVLSASYNDDEIAWYENTDGAGTFGTQQIISTTADNAQSVFAADVDGDGDLDVLSASANDDKIAWYENTNGSGTFGTQQIISTSADWANSVFTADVDGDGDLDVLSASGLDNKIAWYENTDGAGIFGTQQIISTVAIDAQSVFAADMDNDGDIDVLSASYDDDKIAWYENTDGAGTFGSQQVISTAADGAYSVFATDVDGDGDLDALSVSVRDDKIAWYENCGGQFALATADTAPTIMEDEEVDDLLEIVMTHNGQTGDTSAELATLELLFEESASDPLTTAEANALIENLYIYLDDGSDAFESGSDTLVSTVGTLSLTAGVQTVTLADGDANCQIPFGTPKTFFVVTELTADASLYGLVTQFRVTHVTEASSTAEDRDHDITLTMERAANVASSTVSINTDVSNWNLY
jgi:FG-GAP-like repeat